MSLKDKRRTYSICLSEVDPRLSKVVFSKYPFSFNLVCTECDADALGQKKFVALFTGRGTPQPFYGYFRKTELYANICTAMPPKHYHHTSDKEIRALIRTVDAGWNWLQVGMHFVMTRSFVYRLVKEYTDTGCIELRRRGGPL